MCLGFSLISLVEILYYATVKLYQNIPEVYNSHGDEEAIEKSKTSDASLSVLTFNKKKISEIYVADFARYRPYIMKSRK